VPAAVGYDPALPGSNVVRHRLFGEPVSQVVSNRKLEHILPSRGSVKHDQPLSPRAVFLVLKTLETQGMARDVSKVMQHQPHSPAG
jgi:hypothetical protein